MTRRQRDVILLLGSLADAPFAQPRSWTPELVRRNAKRGEVPSTRIPCEACNGERKRRVRTVLVDCDACVGKAGKPLGYRVVDGMIDPRYRRRLATAEQDGEHQTRFVVCDRCGGAKQFGNGRTCTACRGSGGVTVHVDLWRAGRMSVMVETVTPSAPSHDPIVDSLEQRYQAGSYDELARALGLLAGAWPALYRLTRDAYIFGVALHNERLERLALEGGVGYLEARMPDPIRVPGYLRRAVA